MYIGAIEDNYTFSGTAIHGIYISRKKMKLVVPIDTVCSALVGISLGRVRAIRSETRVAAVNTDVNVQVPRINGNNIAACSTLEIIKIGLHDRIF
ncbi:hypothetical protein SmedWSM1115_22830 (plasmid) [Sinorhizobium medicae WSM1115]|uniref:hypothetical protein n=1 Tax=Sinorhizobium medicae TaxID=110321 RepID=UPI000364C7D3|nr:hypothetical protein [Sinorhizobium medicae]UFX05278.1 hypothetical protein SmedWSM1115_22830 [Sinorhizobium medicae WSM1115]